MVTEVPPIFAEAFWGGLAGGPCWATRVVAAARMPVQIRRRFIKMFLLESGATSATRMIVALRGGLGEMCAVAALAAALVQAGSGDDPPAMMRRRTKHGRLAKLSIAGGALLGRTGGGKASAGGGRRQRL